MIDTPGGDRSIAPNLYKILDNIHLGYLMIKQIRYYLIKACEESTSVKDRERFIKYSKCYAKGLNSLDPDILVLKLDKDTIDKI